MTDNTDLNAQEPRTVPSAIYSKLYETAHLAAKRSELLPTLDMALADAGYQNIVLWATPYGKAHITIVREAEDGS